MMNPPLPARCLLFAALLLATCSTPPPPPRTPVVRAARINIALFKHRVERLQREAASLRLKEEGKILLEGMTRE